MQQLLSSATCTHLCPSNPPIKRCISKSLPGQIPTAFVCVTRTIGRCTPNTALGPLPTLSLPISCSARLRAVPSCWVGQGSGIDLPVLLISALMEKMMYVTETRPCTEFLRHITAYSLGLVTIYTPIQASDSDSCVIRQANQPTSQLGPYQTIIERLFDQLVDVSLHRSTSETPIERLFNQGLHKRMQRRDVSIIRGGASTRYLDALQAEAP